MKQLKGFEEDFKENKEKAETWIESHFEKWKKDLTPMQKEIIEKFADLPEGYDLNQILKDVGEESTEQLMTLLPNDFENKYDYISDKYYFDEAFNHLSGKIPNRMFVYQDINLADLRLNQNDFINSDDSLNISAFSDLEKYIVYGKNSQYLEVNVAGMREAKDPTDRIKIRLELPSGTNVVPIKEDTLYLSGGASLSIQEEFSVITIKNKKYILIQAKYEDKKIADDKIINKQEEFNILYSSIFGLSSNDHFYKFSLSDKYASGIVGHAEEALKKLESPVEFGGVEKELLEIAGKFMLEKKGEIIFTDRLLGFVPEVQNPDIDVDTVNKHNHAGGITKVSSRTIVINGRANIYDNENNLNFYFDYKNLKEYLSHEIGHILDSWLGELIYGKNKLWSENDTSFNFYYNLLKPRLSEHYFEYAQSSRAEYFAEIFRFIYSDQIYKSESWENPPEDIEGKKLSDIVQIRVPEIVEHIKDSLTNAKRNKQIDRNSI
ncbi:hypothetical protein [Bacillus cereus group sp. BfR-BA-01538]|uniref:hypothetical protein n=1 Tax=Bacillus cereus group sp. BfR-BA-01538 TaxID=2920373 RepID=UPI001F55B34C